MCLKRNLRVSYKLVLWKGWNPETLRKPLDSDHCKQSSMSGIYNLGSSEIKSFSLMWTGCTCLRSAACFCIVRDVGFCVGCQGCLECCTDWFSIFWKQKLPLQEFDYIHVVVVCCGCDLDEQMLQEGSGFLGVLERARLCYWLGSNLMALQEQQTLTTLEVKHSLHL